MKVTYNNLEFDSEQEVLFYKECKEKNLNFLTQHQYKKKPYRINLNSRKNYTPDFIIIDDKEFLITIIELKGWSKWSGNIDNEICTTMTSLCNANSILIRKWLEDIGINSNGYGIAFKRLKYLKSHGFVDYNFKAETISQKRKKKIDILELELKDIKEELKDYKRYVEYLRKDNLTKKQRQWCIEFEGKYYSE